MARPSKSPDRHRFQDGTGIYAKAGDGKATLREHWDDLRREIDELEADPVWAVDNMEHDLRTTDWMLDKVRSSDAYAQNLYAALCNNEFVRRDVYNVLVDKRWSCSWRHAGGVIADMRQEGDYVDWYCSGTTGGYGTQPEGYVTNEVRSDLMRLGWAVLDDA
jgi:hypothetical protein